MARPLVPILSLCLALCLSSTLHAAVKQTPVNWTLDGTDFSGMLVYDDSLTKPVPGIVMVPNWMGPSENAYTKAAKVAGTNYVVFVVDMYGKDVRPTNAAEAGAAATAVRSDRPMMRKRINEALRVFKAQPNIPYDSAHTAAIGFCFGGGTVLELARSGTAISGVVSFHGDLVSPMPVTEAGMVKTPILVLHGADDPLVPPEHVATFEQEMATAKAAHWQLISFSGAVHSFTNPDADRDIARWHAPSARRSFTLMHGFFDEIFDQ